MLEAMPRRPKSPAHSDGALPLDRLESWLRVLVWVGLVAGLLTPAVYAQLTWFAFTSLKVFWLQVAVGLSLPAYIVLAIRRPEFRPPKTWVLLGVAAQLGAVAITTAFAADPHKAWWGTLDQMEGLWSLLHFGAFATMASGMAKTWPDWRRLVHIEIGVGFFTGSVAILQVPFPMILGQAPDVRISGLFGNPIFSAAFHAIILFLIAWIWTMGKRPSRGLIVLYLASATVSLVAMVLAGSRGPLLGLACGAGIAILAFGLMGGRRKAVRVVVLGLAGTLGLYLSFATLVVPRPGLAAFWERHPNLAHLFILRDNAGRFDFWRLVRSGIGDHPILGWGQENFEALFDRHYVPSEHGSGAEHAHNLVLQTLATTGIVGLAALVFLWGAVIAAILRARRRGDLDALPAAVLVGLPVAQLVQLLFNPDSPGTLLLGYLLFAIAAWLERSVPAVKATSRWKPGLATFVLAELGGLILVVAFTLLPAYASEMALLAVTDYRHNQPLAAFRHAKQAASVPSPYLEDQLAVDLQLLLSQAEARSLDTFPVWRDLFALNRRLADHYLARHTTVRFRLAYARMLHAVGMAMQDPALASEGERRLREILRDHPKRQIAMFALAAVLTELGQLDEAERLYRGALEEAPKIGESRFRLGRFLWKQRNLPSQGANYIVEGTHGECGFVGNSLGELALVAAAMASLGDRPGLASLVPLAETMKPTPVAQPYWSLAKLLEQAGLFAERDRILRLGTAYSPEIAEHAQPILRGQARMLADSGP